MLSRPHHDLSDNTARGCMLAQLIQAASQPAPAGSLEAWTSDASHPEPNTVHAAVGSAWRLHNDLRVMAQYGRVLRNACKDSMFLRGSPETCVEGLEWFREFAQPVEPLSEASKADTHAFLRSCMQHRGTPTAGEAAFDAHRAIAIPSRQLTQFMLEHHFGGSYKQYELDVCAYMLAKPTLTYDAWLKGFPSWRAQGLYFPLALASIYMPYLACWLPADVHDSKVGMSFAECLVCMRDPCREHGVALRRLVEDWAHDDTGAADVLSGKLDRVAILMDVKSNGQPARLTEALDKFASHFPAAELDCDAAEMHAANHAAWHCLKDAVERTFPPSLLAGPLVHPRRDTWGYARLTLEAAPTLRFRESKLQCVKAAALAEGVAHTYQPAFTKDCMLHQTSQRIQDALWRLGEIVTSPDVCLAMLRPEVAMAALDTPPTEAAAAKLAQDLTIDCALERMEARAFPLSPPAPLDECYAAFTQALDASMPQPLTHYLPEEVAVLFWRLDTPPRAIIYVGSGDDVDSRAESTHHLPKVMVNCKVPHRPTGGVLRVPAASCESAVRRAIQTFARDGLPTHPGNTVLITHQCEGQADGGARARQVTPATCTTLAESVACFGLTQPARLTVCSLGESCAWTEDGIDPRYAEKQQASNGLRYRDWTALHVGSNGTQQSRLASHIVRYDCIHTTVIPWFLDGGGLRWVQVSSTLAPEARTLHGKSLRQAVEARFLHDLRMLPTESGAKISKSNCEIYTDSAGTVGIAYCLNNSPRLHFACFECKATA